MYYSYGKNKFNAKKAKKDLDTLFSRAIRSRDKVCQKCLSAKASQAAHIFSRGNLSTRWDEKNALGLCFYCHLYWAHREPVEFTLWITDRMGEKEFKALRSRSMAIYDPSNLKKDYEKKKEELKKL